MYKYTDLLSNGICYQLLSHTCGVYYPCDKPLLYQTGDAL